MQKFKYEIHIEDNVFEKLEKLNIKQHTLDELFKCCFSVMIGEEKYYKFGSNCKDIGIVNDEFFMEVMKKEWKLDEATIKERNKLRSKLEQIEEILKKY